MGQLFLSLMDSGAELTESGSLHEAHPLANAHSTEFGRRGVELDKVGFQGLSWSTEEPDVGPLVRPFLVVVGGREDGYTLI